MQSDSFKVGDKVKAFGCEGVVFDIDSDDEYPIHVKFPNDYERVFSSEGYEELWHKEPSLVLVERAKTKVKLYRALCLHRDQYYMPDSLFKSEVAAIEACGESFIRLLTDDHHAVEVEVE